MLRIHGPARVLSVIFFRSFRSNILFVPHMKYKYMATMSSFVVVLVVALVVVVPVEKFHQMNFRICLYGSIVF